MSIAIAGSALLISWYPYSSGVAFLSISTVLISNDKSGVHITRVQNKLKFHSNVGQLIQFLCSPEYRNGRHKQATDKAIISQIKLPVQLSNIVIQRN